MIAANGLIITTPSPLPNATPSTPYSLQFTAIGGVSPYTWQTSAGTLPPGLTLSSSGLLSGTPTASGAYTFTIRVRDAALSSVAQQVEKTFTLQVDVDTPVITNTFLPTGQALIYYSVNLTASGGAPPYTFSIVSGSLPPGFTLTPAGQLSGTAGDALSAPFTAQVTDRAGRSSTRPLVLSIATQAPPPRLRLEVLTTLVPDGTVGKLYATTFLARNGTPPYNWSFGNLPEGFSGSSNGDIIGTPRRPGTFSIQASVTDDLGERATATFSLVVKTAPIIISTERVPDGRVDQAYSTSFTATGGLPSYSFSLAGGTLPPGLTLSANGLLNGIPTEPGTFSFTVQATDSTGEKGLKSFSVVIRPAPLQITTITLPGGFVNVAYSAAVAATGGIRPYRWSASGLPDGLVLNADTGAISGTASTNGSFPVTFRVTDSALETASKTITIDVTTQITITNASFGTLIAGTPVNVGLSATGGRPPYSWTVLSGSLPEGLNLSSAGTISGSPTAPGDYSVSIGIRDANNVPGSKSFSGRVLEPLVITTQTAPPIPFGAAYSLTLVATGGTQPYTWSVIGGTLPTGLALSSAGSITGTTTQPRIVQHSRFAQPIAPLRRPSSWIAR